ncbi:MAG: c-type cytochrome [Rhodothermaceae bacterium]|nr:c-type cytochrome [Rhodothermaceae bacterium]
MKRTLAILWCLALCTVAYGQDNLTNMPDPDPATQLASFRVKDGFEVNLYVSDPMIDPPIQMAWDEQGRMWLATSTSYPQPLPGQEINDKIFVLEDLDGDGEADQSIVFAEGLLTPTGILPGDGGVYVVNSTELLHMKDTNGDGRADEKRVVLSGFGADDTHHLLHTLRWGPDGKLYMNQSVYTYSHIETPWGVKRLRGGGIWRFDTETLELEVFSRGLWNPWGYEIAKWGQSFATDGAGFQGIHFMFPDVAYNPAVGVEKVLEGLNIFDPKYSGLALVSGRHMPDSIQGDLITNDFRANRVKHFVLAEDSSGFSATQLEDLIWSDHYAFRPVDVTIGPDGAIYLVDWYNPIIQHGEVDFRDPRRDHRHGRIWRVTAKDRALIEPPDLLNASTVDLLDALKEPEMWTRRMANRLLREKGAAAVGPELDRWVESLHADETHAKLEALWVYQALKSPQPGLLADLLSADDHRARSAALRVLFYWIEDVDDGPGHLEKAIDDLHPQVRREALHALSRLDHAEAVQTALRALDHPMDEFIEYALWNTVRSLSSAWLPAYVQNRALLGTDPKKITYALRVVEDPFAIEQLAALYEAGQVPDNEVEAVLQALGDFGGAGDMDILFDMVLRGKQQAHAGIQEHQNVLLSAVQGREIIPGEPERIETLFDHESTEVRVNALRLAGEWGVESLQDRLETIASDTDESQAIREASLEAIAALGVDAGKSFLISLTEEVDGFEMRLASARWLAAMDMEAAVTPALQVLQEAPTGSDPLPLLRAFTRQENGYRVLADAISAQPVPAFIAQAGFDNLGSRSDDAKALKEALKTSGAVELVPKLNMNPSWFELQRFEHDSRAQGSVERGREVYHRPTLQCTVCHVIEGEGGVVGPDLSSIGVTAPTDYLIESLLKPEEALKDGYALVQVTKKDGGIMVGLLAGETNSSLLMKDAAGNTNSIPLSQVESRSIIPGSLMPAGLVAQLERDEFLDLLAFLSSLGKEESE